MAKRILLVDDEPLIIKGLKYTLEQEGYETISAMDGEEALNIFFSNSIDLILLDVMLPKLDGIQVCQRIRESSNVPIIMLTAKGEDMDKILGLILFLIHIMLDLNADRFILITVFRIGIRIGLHTGRQVDGQLYRLFCVCNAENAVGPFHPLILIIAEHAAAGNKQRKRKKHYRDQNDKQETKAVFHHVFSP